jgi:hypothetical protein
MHIPQLVNLKISIPITLFGDSKPLDGKPVRSAYQSEISCRPRARNGYSANTVALSHNIFLDSWLRPSDRGVLLF